MFAKSVSETRYLIGSYLLGPDEDIGDMCTLYRGQWSTVFSGNGPKFQQIRGNKTVFFFASD